MRYVSSSLGPGPHLENNPSHSVLPRIPVTTDIHHISPDTNAEMINQASTMTIHLFFCSFSQFFCKAAEKRSSDAFWKYCHQYVQLVKGYWVADIWRREKPPLLNLFIRIKHIGFLSKKASNYCLVPETFSQTLLFWAQIHQRSPPLPNTHYHCAWATVYLPSHPRPQWQSSPQLMKEIAHSFCVNELALLLLNDVCKWWPSLLPVSSEL